MEIFSQEAKRAGLLPETNTSSRQSLYHRTTYGKFPNQKDDMMKLKFEKRLIDSSKLSRNKIDLNLPHTMNTYSKQGEKSKRNINEIIYSSPTNKEKLLRNVTNKNLRNNQNLQLLPKIKSRKASVLEVKNTKDNNPFGIHTARAKESVLQDNITEKSEAKSRTNR